MKERVILVRNVNESSFLRSLALKGINTFGLRVMNPFDLACEVLIRNGKVIGNVIPSSERCLFIYNILKTNSYFKINKLADARLFIEALDELRLNVLDENKFNELLNGEFIDKNIAIIYCYNEYKEKLLHSNLVDEIMVIKKVINDKLTIDCEIICANEFPLKEVDKELLRIVSNNNYKEIKINDNEDYAIEEYVSCYGTTNECEYVLSTIYNNSDTMKFDNCVVAVTEPNIYKKTFSDLAAIYNIPISFGISKTLGETNTGKLLKLIIDFLNDYSSSKAFKNIIKSEFFDYKRLIERLGFDLSKYEDNKRFNNIIDTVGALRITFEKEDNDKKLINLKDILIRNNDERLTYIEKIELIINMFNNGIDGFLRENVKRNNIDTSETKAIESISSLLYCAKLYNVEERVALEDVYNLSVGSNLAEEGKLYVCSLEKAKQVLRKHLFVVGLSSAYFPGGPKENHILLDSDFALFGIKNKSNRIVEEKKEEYYNLLKIKCGNIRLSYSNFSLADLKGQNASSLLFETFSKINPNVSYKEFCENGYIKEVKYFESNISKNTLIGKTYINGKKIIHDENVLSKSLPTKVNVTRAFSASKIVDFFKCQYKFYLLHIVGLEDPFDEDSSKVIQTNDMGTLIHSVMEHNDTFNCLDDYYDYLEKEFKEFLVTHPTLTEEIPTYTIEEMKEYVKNAYEMIDKGATVLTKETDAYATVNGVKIHGLPDLVIRLSDGRIKIVDYKIKNKVEHDKNDTNSIMQILVYAYVLNSINKNGDRVALGEFRYLKQHMNITIENMNERLQEFEEKMVIFKNALDNNCFEKANNDEKCKYCKFKEFCLSNLEEEEEE